MPELDCASMPDRSDEVPDLKPYLRKGEKVISVQHCPTPAFEKLPDYRDELAKLCGVDSPKEIGKNGPAMAARAAKQTEGQGLFECRFGRDGLIAAKNVMQEFPLLTRTTLLDYAGLIGMIENTHREEEFGRMFHEARDPNDPKAKKLTEKHGWGWPFYASVDATPLFVNVLHHYVSHSDEGRAFLEETFIGRDGEQHSMWEALQFSMMWIISRMNRNPEHFLEYRAAFPTSHLNQVMEDSWDSHFHSDGRLANFVQGIASIEVQALAYDALLAAAHLTAHEDGATEQGSYYSKIARELRENVVDNFWNEQEGFFALGSDRNEHGRIEVMEIRKAISFFILDSNLLDRRRMHNEITACIRSLFSRELLCAAGIRSLALDEQRFMPGAYHNGNSWLMQTFQIAEGLRRHGYYALAAELDRRIVRTVEETRLYPEFVNGGTQPEIRLNERIIDTWDPADKRKNRREQPPQQIQLWTLTAYAAIQYRKQLGNETIAPKPFEEEILSNL